MMEKETIKTDVAVIGSGPGGIAAAVAAARQGVKVLLVERLGFLGGQLGSGLPFLAFLDMHQRQVVGGLAQKLVEDLDKLGGTAGHQYCPLHLSSTTVNQFYTRILCFQWAKELGIQLLMHCELSGAEVSGGRLKSVTVSGKGKAFEIEAKVFIDGTGDGDLGFMSGASFEIGQEKTGLLQPPTLMFNLSGVNFDRFADYISAHPEELPYNTWLPHLKPGYDGAFFKKNPGHIFVGLQGLLGRLRAEGKCPVSRDTIIYIRQPIPGTVAVNTIRILNFDGSNIHDLSRGEMEAHLQILPLIELFKKNIPGFEDAYLTSINPGIGVRESRRIMGIKKLTGEDVSAGRIPEDSIGLFSYFIDIHSGDGAETYTKAVEEPYGVPYGCTVSKDLEGLMMTGRCISTDATALGSARIMTLCMAIGEGAGTGAALAVQQGISPAKVDPKEVRKILLKWGAILQV
jgi:hypothetical protein